MEPERGVGAKDEGVELALPGDLLCLALAHEIKNDLQALIGLLSVIEGEGALPPRLRQWAARGLRIGEASSMRLRSAAGALVEQTHATVSDAREPLRDPVERAVLTANLRDTEGEVGRRVVVFGNAGEAVTERPFLLELAVVNLLSNAVRATPAGAPPARVTLRASEGGAWEVGVEDSGPGLPEEARRVLTGEVGALTEVDFSEASSRWGIGLILVRAAAAAAGWDIRAEARTGGTSGPPPGSRITVSSTRAPS
ncbi:MAG TPA: ATP-binding protein [Candidatus Thermoplasmatota archaeon]|nr:ATP-binding protein [Candidatus Thermoplasmatota archaeon]